MRRGKLAVNLWREIRRTKMRFFSILAIAFLGTAFFAGLRSTSPDMKITGDNYFDQSMLADITVMSSAGLTPEDVRAIAKLPGVKEIEPAVTLDAMMQLLSSDAAEENVHLISMPFALPEEKPTGLYFSNFTIDPALKWAMNQLTIVAGRLPLDDHEVALDSILCGDGGPAVGDYVLFTSPGGSVRLRVVGIVESPRYISLVERGTSTVGNGTSGGYAYASGNAIGKLGTRLPMMAMLSTRYTEAGIRVSGAMELNCFSGEYQALVDDVMAKIEAYGESKEGDATWYVFHRDKNPGYLDYRHNADRIGAVAQLFPLIFFVVAALVALTTMTRMVDEQRVQMGTLKALGYRNAAILSEYLIYSALATVAGGMLGCVLGSWLFPKVIMAAYSIMYKLPNVVTPLHWDITITAIAASVLCISGAALLSAIGSLQEAPASLMRPKAPKAGKRVFLEHIAPLWKRMSFTSKVTARNLIRYKKRFWMSIVGIAGSCALLLTGFGLQDAIYGIIDRQFGEIWTMDVQAYTYDPMPLADFAALLEQRDAEQNAHDVMYCYNKAMDAGRGTGEQTSVYLMMVDDPASLSKLVALNTEAGKNTRLPHDGVVITKKLASIHNLKPGNLLTLETGNKKYQARISSVAENYVEHYVYISASYYEEVFGKPAAYNGFMARLHDTGETARETFSHSLLLDQRMYTVSFTTGLYESISDSLGILSYVVYVLIISAAALAFVVMFNLTNINITERRREMATLQVLGFLDHEMYRYVFRENNALAVLGSLAGLGLGIILHKFVIETCEVDIVMFVREIAPMSFVYSFCMTVAFSLMVKLFMRRKVREVDMVESLKSAE